ncbi:transcription initiation factor IIB [Thermosphaera sp.]
MENNQVENTSVESGKESKPKPLCPQEKLVYDSEHGEYVCLETGEVVEEKIIDERPEWRAFTPEERGRRARTGGPLTTTVHDMGFATAIDYSNKDAAGRKLMGKRQELIKLRKWQARTRILTSMDRNLAQAMNELERLGDLLNLPSHVKEEAARIYREAVEKGLVRGRSIESVIAAAVYVACRELKVPRSLDEVSRHTRIGRKDIARCYRLLLRELDIKVGTTDPIDYVPRIVHALGLPGTVVKRAVELLNVAREHGVTGGKDPAGLAAAAVYVAALEVGEKRTQKEVAHVAGVTEVTVRNRYKELAKIFGLDANAV